MKSFTSTLKKLGKINNQFSLLTRNSLLKNSMRNFAAETVRLFIYINTLN
jgi:hypothetical protein